MCAFQRSRGQQREACVTAFVTLTSCLASVPCFCGRESPRGVDGLAHRPSALSPGTQTCSLRNVTGGETRSHAFLNHCFKTAPRTQRRNAQLRVVHLATGCGFRPLSGVTCSVPKGPSSPPGNGSGPPTACSRVSPVRRHLHCDVTSGGW